jgi:hypothetical protein
MCRLLAAYFQTILLHLAVVLHVVATQAHTSSAQPSLIVQQNFVMVVVVVVAWQCMPLQSLPLLAAGSLTTLPEVMVVVLQPGTPH